MGTRKVLTLVDCGAVVTVISPVVTEKLGQLGARGLIKLKKRFFKTTDLDDRFLVFGATNDEELNNSIHKAAEHRGILCNIADRPHACNFILPSIVQRKDLLIAISTSGKSPAFAKSLRKKLEKEFGDEYGEFLDLMGDLRKRLLAEKHEPEAHKHLFETLIDSNLLKMIKNRQIDDINALLYKIFGKGYEVERESLRLKA